MFKGSLILKFLSLMFNCLDIFGQQVDSYIAICLDYICDNLEACCTILYNIYLKIRGKL